MICLETLVCCLKPKGSIEVLFTVQPKIWFQKTKSSYMLKPLTSDLPMATTTQCESIIDNNHKQDVG